MKKVRIEKTMTECLLEAFKNNAIITSDGLGEAEFIHVYNGKAYYEDGGCLGYFSEANDLLNSQEWTHEHKWYIIGYLDEQEIQAIKKMRNNPRVYESFWYEKEINQILDMGGSFGMKCNNLCFRNEQTCTYCKEHRNVSSDFYKAKRPANGQYVIGYLVKNKNGEIEGILNKDNHFSELAWIDENTIERVEGEILMTMEEFMFKGTVVKNTLKK